MFQHLNGYLNSPKPSNSFLAKYSPVVGEDKQIAGQRDKTFSKGGFHMEPTEIVNDICQAYLKDLTDVDPALIARVDGLRRARDLTGLTSCSKSFDAALHTIEDFRFLRQIESFYKKNAIFVHNQLCAEAAREAFFQS